MRLNDSNTKTKYIKLFHSYIYYTCFNIFNVAKLVRDLLETVSILSALRTNYHKAACGVY